MDTVFSSLPDGVILLDGSMGQELINRKASGQGVLWSAKALFDAPGVVQEVHEDYIRAGACIIGGCCEVGPAHIAQLNLLMTRQLIVT